MQEVSQKRQYSLTRTIASRFGKATVYGKANDKVTLIEDHGEVLIVENGSGVRFPVQKEDVK